LAQLSVDQKNTISHRAKAFAKVRKMLSASMINV
jgi:inosine/xanthosine triphosphate pyrophosphatase family protein